MSEMSKLEIDPLTALVRARTWVTRRAMSGTATAAKLIDINLH